MHTGIVSPWKRTGKVSEEFPLSAIKEQVEVEISTVRVLIVDDFVELHSLIKTHLEHEAKWEIVGSALDGLDAIQKAVDLRPDLVLLDIHLPKLNGIEAARQIRELVPRARILFLSSNTHQDVVEAALNAGGLGYIPKWKIAECLLPGMQSVLEGQPFILFD